eukprot:TRINITY_DN6832_c0_g1_i2.p1 TRINITY_DN6832_c0_g1~~TRINITY_DN6832_c0_g1_i2.p1  ORF type:complete len:162 (-),score=29.57 TRINITY_DN6832_c0_g1_i2:78-563(-)
MFPATLLKLTVVKARNLAPKDSSGKSDPFCVVRVGKTRKRKTSVIRQNLNPEWPDGPFSFPSFSNDVDVKIVCYDWDNVKNDYLGAFVIPKDFITKAFTEGSSEKWFPLKCLKTLKTGVSGEILVKLEFPEKKSPVHKKLKKQVDEIKNLPPQSPVPHPTD